PGPRWLARFNRRFGNPLLTRLAGGAPGFGIITHRGRRSGKCYRTPVNIFPRGDRFVIAQTYGPASDWVKNVLAAGGCELRAGGGRSRRPTPRVFPDETRRTMPRHVRRLLRLFGVSDFMALDRAPASSSPSTVCSTYQDS